MSLVLAGYHGSKDGEKQIVVQHRQNLAILDVFGNL